MNTVNRMNSVTATGGTISNGLIQVAPASDTLGNAAADPVGNMYVITAAGHAALVTAGTVDDGTFYIIVG